MNQLNPLEVLSLPAGSSLEDAQKRWRHLSQQCHPDHNPGNPEAAQRFIDITEAYRAIKSNPSILSGNVAKSEFIFQAVVVPLHVTVKDVYLGTEFPIKIDRYVYCKSCSGTGSWKKQAGVCAHCNGAGKITSTVLNLLNRNPICPVCEGAGVPKENLCPKCNGTKRELDSSVRKIRISIKDYQHGTVIIKSAGHQQSKDAFSNAFIKITHPLEEGVRIEDTYFSVYERILPVQRIIGDQGVLHIFGRAIKYPIVKNDTEVYIKDTVKPGLVQEIRIRYIETPPVITEETLEMYRKILEIEKKISL